MKIKHLLLICASAILAMGCTTKNNTKPDNGGETEPGGGEQGGGGDQGGGGQGGGDQGGGGSQDPVKVVIPAHILSDSNPPINVNSKGQQVSKATWDSFRYGTSSKFSGNYNYTYQSMSGGMVLQEKFTKNGYSIVSSTGTLYYERKSGSTFYTYTSTNEGLLRSETTFDIQEKYTSRIIEEIKVHMFDFENYEYDEDDGFYRYQTTAFGNYIKFQNGYLTSIQYGRTGASFVLDASFETTIEIPKSYYYQD